MNGCGETQEGDQRFCRHADDHLRDCDERNILVPGRTENKGHTHRGSLHAPPRLTSSETTMDPRPGMIIHNGALYHGHSTRDSANPDEEMLEQVVFVEDQEEGDEDEDMTPKYYSFDETSETGTSTPGSTHVEFPAHQQGYAEDEAGFEDEDMEPKYKGMLPSGSSTHNVHSRPSDSSENAAKKTRYHPSSVAPSFERGPSKRRSGQTVTANQQLMSTLKTRQEQHEHDLAEVKETYSRYVSRLEEEARKKEQAHQEEWVSYFCSVFSLISADRHFIGWSEPRHSFGCGKR